MIRNCWKVSGQNADKLLATIKEMLKTFTEALEAKNKGSIYTEAELNILKAFDRGLTAQKNATSEQRSSSLLLLTEKVLPENTPLREYAKLMLIPYFQSRSMKSTM